MEATKKGSDGGGSKKDEDPTAEKSGWKVCRGCTYYSSRLRSDAQPHVARVYERLATREGKLSNFKYCCLGYSVFFHDKDLKTENQQNHQRLPICLGGYELLVGRRSKSGETRPTPLAGKKSGEARGTFLRSEELFVRYLSITGYARSKGYIKRFTRNTELVASGVTKNLLRFCSYVKDKFDDTVYPNRKRPE